jgi:hypothetical protein
MREERFLQAVEERSALREALDGGNGATIGLPDGNQARTHGIAIEQHGTGTAVAGIAANFGSGEAKIFTQETREPLGGRRTHAARFAIHDEGERD